MKVSEQIIHSIRPSLLHFLSPELPYIVDYNTGFGVYAVQNKTAFWDSDRYRKKVVESIRQLAVFDVRQEYDSYHMYSKDLVSILNDIYHNERSKCATPHKPVRHVIKLRFLAQSASSILTSMNILANYVARDCRGCSLKTNGIVLQVFVLIFAIPSPNFNKKLFTID